MTIPWHLDRGRARGELGYQPGLDGLRALAVIGVLLFHGGIDSVPGGFLGVDVFFVLSGFLISTLLLEELDRSDRVRFGTFYLRRARRLLPALLVLLAVLALAVGLVYTDAAAALRRDGLAALTYVTNWWYIFSDQSYFEFTGRPPLLAHLWSLAIEEQFYLLWPVLLFLLYRLGKRHVVGWIAFLGAIASTAWMWWLADEQAMPLFADPSRIYFGTDSHIMGLLIGAALATFWRPGRLPTHVPKGARWLLTGTGIGAIALIVAAYVVVSEYTAWLYRGGFLYFSLLVALAIAMLTHPAIALGRIFATQPMRYIGQRSYGLYLWHWPVVLVTRPGLDTPWDGSADWHPWATAALRIVLTFGIAELSYRFIEIPIRRGALGNTWRAIRSRSAQPRRIALAAAGAVATVALATTSLVVLVRAETPAVAADVAAALGLDSGGPTVVSIESTALPNASPSTNARGLTTEELRSANGAASAIGDSVMLGARKTLQEVIPGIGVDASVARMPGAFTGRVKKLAKKEALANIVVLHPGTNGVLPDEILRATLDPLTDYQRVVLVNAAVPRSWEKSNNAVVRKVAKDYPNVVIADWNTAAQGHRDYFVSDGVHLTAKGARAYAEVIKEAAGL